MNVQRGEAHLPDRICTEEELDWKLRAKCRSEDPERFFPEKYESTAVTEETKQFCQTCPVKEPCLELGLAFGPSGIWGGTSVLDRKRIRRARRNQLNGE